MVQDGKIAMYECSHQVAEPYKIVTKEQQGCPRGWGVGAVKKGCQPERHYQTQTLRQQHQPVAAAI